MFRIILGLLIYRNSDPEIRFLVSVISVIMQIMNPVVERPSNPLFSYGQARIRCLDLLGLAVSATEVE